MKLALSLLFILLAGCQSVPESKTVTYRAVSREQNARAVVAILKCLKQPQCDELLGNQLECGPFLWRQLAVTGLNNRTSYTLPVTIEGGSKDVAWEGRQCVNHEEVLALWRAFAAAIPQETLKTIRSLNKQECRVYSTLVPGEIREPVFIVEGRGHKVLMQLVESNGRSQLTFIDDFRNVVIRD